MKTEDGNEGLHPWIEPELEARLTALVLGEASDFEREELERLIAERPELGLYRKRLEAMHRMLREVATGESGEEQGEWKLGAERREVLLAKLGVEVERGSDTSIVRSRRSGRWRTAVKIAACVALAGLLLSVMWPSANGLFETAHDPAVPVVEPLFVPEQPKAPESSIASKFAVRLEENTQKADEAARRGSQLMADGDYQGAADQYRAALDLLPDVPTTEPRRRDYVEQFSNAGNGLAFQRAEEGRYPEATAMIEEILQPSVDPGNKDAQRLLGRLNDPDYYSPALTPAQQEHARRVELAQKNAEGYLALGDFDRADREFNRALNEGRYNSAARRGPEENEQHRLNYYDAAYDHTRARMLAEIRDRWETPGGAKGDQSVSNLTAGDSISMVGVSRLGEMAAEPPPGIAEQEEKLKSIVIPSVDFKDTPLKDAIAFLEKQSVEFDPAKEGVKISAERVLGEPATPAPDPFGLKVPDSNESEETKISLRLSNVPLAEALRYTSSLAGTKYKVEPDKVAIVPVSTPDADLFTNVYQVPPTFLSDQSLGTGGSAAPADPFADPVAAGNTVGPSARPTAKSILESAGISFPTGASAIYNAETGQLIVRNTQDQMELVEAFTESVGGSDLDGEKTAPSDLAAVVPEPAASPMPVTAMPSTSRAEVGLEFQTSSGVIVGQTGSGTTAASKSPLTDFERVPLAAPKPAEPTVATSAMSSFSLPPSSAPSSSAAEFGRADQSRTEWEEAKNELGKPGGEVGKPPVAGAPIQESIDLGGEISAGYMTDHVYVGNRFGFDDGRKQTGQTNDSPGKDKSVADILALTPQVGQTRSLGEEVGLRSGNSPISEGKIDDQARVISTLDVENDEFLKSKIGDVLKRDTRDSVAKGPAILPVDSRLRQPTPAALDETSPSTEPFSTFSLHVSDVSFQLAKSSLASGKWPEAAKIRIEEFVNAFDYSDPVPSMGERVSCRIDQGAHPFLQQRNLVRIALRTAEAGRSAGTPLRLTLLLDSSGSMERPDRRATLTRAVATLAGLLGDNDKVTLVSFARQPRLVADAVAGNEAMKLAETVAALPSEGGTNLEAALELAFEKAREHQEANAQNRIVLLTDGAANLGDAKAESLGARVEMMREAGIAFDAAGFGADGLNDEILEALTRKGDGRYYLLDRPEDAEDAFAKQIAGALRPAAKNVKVQVEFNPDRVKSYKLLGFEKHRLETEDFRNDAVDAAEMAAAEAGVAVYQVEPDPGGEGDLGSVSVRFRDLDSGDMIERRWALPHVVAPAADQGGEAILLATVASQFAAKLAGGPLGDVVDLAELARMAAALPESERVKELRTMIEQARDLKGNR